MARLNLVSPTGRIVAGSVSKPNLKDMHGKDREKPQYFIALAIPKTDPNLPQLFQTIYQHALSEFSRHQDVLRRINLGLQKNTGFAWKIEDGDLPSAKTGKLREGWSGCWVLKLSTTIAPRAVDVRNNPIDPAVIECGYYADVAFSVAGNDKIDHTAGLYMNPNFVRLLGYGERINTGPTPDQVFGAPGTAMGSPTPFASGPMSMQQSAPAGMPGIGYGGGNMTQPQYQPQPPVPPMGNAFAGFAGPATPQPFVQNVQPQPSVFQQGMTDGPLGIASTVAPQPQNPPAMTGSMAGGVAGTVQPSSPLVLPVSGPAAQDGATSGPAPMPVGPLPGSISETASVISLPTIPGFSSGAAQ